MDITLSAEAIHQDLQQIRGSAPLVHNITNFVVMNNTANALLALGASPVMAHAEEEVTGMVQLAAALVLNIGTLSPAWVRAMMQARQVAAERKIPIVLDPVGAGATPYRTQVSRELLTDNQITIIRGNASEIMALTDSKVITKGVDSSNSDIPLEAATELARAHNATVVVSGPTDLITDGKRCTYINNGHALMPRVTGLGCTATALIGAFAAVQSDAFKAAAHAMAVMGICGELAATKAAGPGSLQMHFLDCLYLLDAEQIKSNLKS